MKKLLLIISITSLGTNYAQESTDTKEKSVYNRWSIEINAGQNKPIRPFATGYYSSNPTKSLNFSEINHYDVGVRYMLSNTFGLKLDYSMDQFNEQSGAGSLSFDTKLNRFGLQGVMNLGRLLHFESFTNRIGILTHAGLQISQFSVNNGTNKNSTENNAGVLFGITPQIRLTNWMTLTSDFTVINNIRQHLNWDGSNASSHENLSGVLYYTSLGFTFYLGKEDKHADWYSKEDVLSRLSIIDEEARKRLDEIETLMNDTDRDGVVDYLDAENNTPGGVTVDTKGRFIDINKNGTPDEMEPRNSKETVSALIKKAASAEMELVENGFINIYFDVNTDTPNTGSTNNIYIILRYLKEHPDSKIKLFGFSDITGDEKNNIELSKKRALKIANYLTDKGINTNRISIEGIGKDENYNSSSNLDTQLSRRVSIQINNFK